MPSMSLLCVLSVYECVHVEERLAVSDKEWVFENSSWNRNEYAHHTFPGSREYNNL
jgi:hypothetical protein